jgi:hypothetical protein
LNDARDSLRARSIEAIKRAAGEIEVKLRPAPGERLARDAKEN